MNRLTLFEDTIAAVATAPGRAAIACVRVSGFDTKRIIQALTQRELEPRKATLVPVKDPQSGQLIDRAIAIFYASPKSYTGEDMVEFFTHGGLYVPQSVLRAILHLGARIALPGEFTKRALINGKLSLTQAEAIEALVDAKSGHQHRLALNALEGKLLDVLNPLRETLLRIAATLNVELDYPEEVEIDPSTLAKDIEKARGIAESILRKSERALKYTSGLEVVIAGKPNVGKSSLLNRFLEEDRAIVTEIPGTTRDTITEMVEIGGVLLKITDTAGVRKTTDQIEKIGVERALKAIERANLVLFVVDASRSLDEDDHTILKEIARLSKPHLVVINKIDVVERVDVNAIREELGTDAHIVTISALKGEGLAELERYLEQTIKELVGETIEATLINHRQLESLKRCLSSIEKAMDALKEGYPNDIVAIEIRDAITALDELTGKSYTDDLLDTIFNTFCVGK
ncbi:MAG: tRNA modification GTPase [Thermotogota bacterium]|nr:tRNA modification GTPase [Thermotogota bacterium]MDK2865065.1 tRNA modification GTPase [Thermotogota bacterium]HCZ06597.1 tRNA uridine-5-carboxymethylaminomethyl(34) synthesis GTPase MnmE [Thermotogota bacterium]